MTQGTVLFSTAAFSDCRAGFSRLVAGRPFFSFIIIFKKSQPASGVTEVVGLAGARLGVAELKLKLVSWLATAFCGAQRHVMPASYMQFDKPWCWDGAGYRHRLNVNSYCAGYCRFSPGAGKQGGGFISPRVRGAVCSMQTYPQPSCRALTLLGRADPGRRCVPRALVAHGCLRWVRPRVVVGLRQRLGWHVGPGWGSEVTRGSSVAEGWHQGWGTAAVAPRHKQGHAQEP